MVNAFFELGRLRTHLANRGVDEATIEDIISKASAEINSIATARGEEAVDEAVQIGAQQESADFINQLRLDTVNFEVKTESGQLSFSEPPRPMLPFLLKNAKPNKDGSGVHKVIPVGKQGNKPSFAKNIIDEQRRISAERIEAAKSRARAIAPAGSQIFRTASSKQNPMTQWVQPAKEKDFTEDVRNINQNLKNSLDDSIHEIINNYMDLF